jgi:hypothetical protein
LEEKKQGKSRKKKGLRWLLYGSIILLSMLVLLTVLLNLPPVQSMIARRMSAWVSGKTGDSLSVAYVKINLFKGIEVRDISLRDSTGTPMVFVGRLQASPAFYKLLSGKFFIRHVRMDTIDFRLTEYKKTDNYAFIRFIDKLSSGDTTPAREPFRLAIGKIRMTHLHFQLKNENKPDVNVGGNTMNYDNIEVSQASLLAHNFLLTGDSITFQLDNLTAHERSGLFLRKMKSRMVISGKRFSFQNTVLETNHSQLNFDYAMLANGWDDYSNFIDSVKLQARFRSVSLNMSDIGYFAGVMFKMPDNIKLRGGRVEGPISRLSGKNLHVQYGRSTRFIGDVNMRGLPDFYSTDITAHIKSFVTCVHDLKRFAIPAEQKQIPVPEQLDTTDRFRITGDFNGSFYHFFTRLNINTNDSGRLQFTLKLKADTARIENLALQVKARGFPLNRFTGNSLAGTADFSGSLHLYDSLKETKAQIQLDAQKLTLNGYPLQNLHYRGNYALHTLYSHLKTDDPHLRFTADGFVLFGERPHLRFDVDIARADFKPFHLWEQKDFHLKGLAKLDFTGISPDTATGLLRMKNAVAGFGNDSYPVHSAVFEKTRTADGKQSLHFQSDLFDFQATGKYRLSSLIQGIPALVHSYIPGAARRTDTVVSFDDTVFLTLNLKKPEFIGEHFVYGLNISPNTAFTASFNLQKKSFSVKGYAKKLVYQGIEALHNHLDISTQNHLLHTKINILHLILRDRTQTDKTVFGLDSLRTQTLLGNDSMVLKLFWHNDDSLWLNKGVLSANYVNKGNFKQIRITQAKIYVNDTLWEVNPANRVAFQNNQWKFEKLIVNGGHSQFAVQGHFPKNNGDSLSVVFRSWNLSNLDLLYELAGFDIDGIMNGNILITRLNNRNARIADLTVEHFALNHTLLGKARILSTWNTSDNSAFIKAQVVRQAKAGKERIIGLFGFYYPYRDTASLDLSMNFNHLQLKALNPFFNEYISHLEGNADGEMTLKGSVKNPALEGFIDIKQASLVVNYLNTKYSFHQRITFNKDRINFGKFILSDTLGNTAVLQGEILHHYFRDMRLNFDIQTQKLLFFNTTRQMNDIYYGKAIASGDIKITGPVNDIKLNITAHTIHGTSVVIPLDYTSEVPDKDYIVFKPPPTDSSRRQPQETVLKLPKEQKSKYAIGINLDIRPDANLKIYLPSNMGDIQTNGSGNLNLFVNSEGDMKLSGDYVVNKGEFNFSLGNLVRKHFELVKGGRISWAGDPYRATVYLKGLYKLKANLSSLGIVVDSSADYKNRTQVNCYIIMSHDLFHPDIRFQIHFPELDPDMQRLVYAQLDTNNMAVMNQQMISLLVLGAFSFSNASNISWSTSYYTILTNQLSGMLSKISKDFDIGVNYKPGDALTKQEFDVALSTQLFDDRLIINGNFGMTYDKQNKSANNLVGDVDIAYKLTKDGRWMLKAYNHSNMNSWYYYSDYDKVSPYTQGVGIVYRKEFNSLADLFRRRNRKVKKEKNSTKNTKK